jgi:hypothetical protein
MLNPVTVERRLSRFDQVVGGVAAAAITAAVLLGQLIRAHLIGPALPPLCWSQILLGRECPGCGLTRSFAAIGRGAFREASLLNPLGPILFGVAVALLLTRAGRIALPRFRYWSEVDAGLAIGAVLCLVVRTVAFYAA